MSRTTVQLEDVTLSFPRTRVTLAPIGRSILSLFGGRPKRRDEYTALRNVSLDVQEGEVLGVVGRNGAGKSTLLRVIAGIYRPDTGRARTRGRVSLLAGLGVGFNVNLSGRENAYLYGSILGHQRQVMNELLDGIIEFSGLGDFIDQPLRTYSSGMRARLGFSIATATKPDILLIDEVLGVGDTEFRDRSLAHVRQMVKEARTVLIASHSFPMLRQVCRQAILMEKGKLVTKDTLIEVGRAYRGDAPSKAEKAAAEAAQQKAQQETEQKVSESAAKKAT